MNIQKSDREFGEVKKRISRAGIENVRGEKTYFSLAFFHRHPPDVPGIFSFSRLSIHLRRLVRMEQFL